MLAAVTRIARFMQTLDDAQLAGAFADPPEPITIIENFAPHVFTGPDAVADWAAGFRAHAADMTDLEFRFGRSQDYNATNERAFLTLPTRWTGRAAGRRFTERGGWAFVFVRQSDQWRIAAYAWAVTSVRWFDPA